MQVIHLEKYIPPDAGEILEFSCGDGALVQRFRMVNPKCRYWCVTNTETSIKELRKIATGVFLRKEPFADLDEIGFGGRILDCIVYTGYKNAFLQNGEGLKNHFKALKNGGQVICYLKNIRYLKQIWSGMANAEGRFSVEQCRTLFEQAGVYVYEIIPVLEEQLKKQWKEKNKEIVSLLEGLSKIFHEKTVEPIQALAEGFIVRAVKGPVPRKLSLQVFLGETAVCARPRIYEPHSFCLTEPGVENLYYKSDAQICSSDMKDQVFIWQRKWFSPAVLRKTMQSFIENRYLVIAECDDDPFFRLSEQDIYERRYSLAACHGIQVSTPALAEFLGQFNPEIAVFQNQLLYLPQKRVFENQRMVTFFFGALNREMDWRPLLPQLNRILQKYKGRVAIKVIYDKAFFASLDFDDKEFFPFCTYETYIQILRQSDIAFLPLGDTRMNRMKSDLKFLECAGNGVCVLASPVVYEKTIENWKTGLIYHDEQEFGKGLEALIEDTALRERLREAAYSYVKEHRLLCQHYKERLYWYRRLLKELPERNRDLVKRMDGLSDFGLGN